MRFVLLVGTLAELDSGHALYANRLFADGHEVWIGTLNGLTGAGIRIQCPMGQVDGPLKAFGPFLGKVEVRDIAGANVVWVLNYPYPGVQEVAWQLLWQLNQQVPLTSCGTPAGLGESLGRAHHGSGTRSDQRADLVTDTEQSPAVDLGRDGRVDQRVPATGLLISPDALQRISVGEAFGSVDGQQDVQRLS